MHETIKNYARTGEPELIQTSQLPRQPTGGNA